VLRIRIRADLNFFTCQDPDPKRTKKVESGTGSVMAWQVGSGSVMNWQVGSEKDIFGSATRAVSRDVSSPFRRTRSARCPGACRRPGQRAVPCAPGTATSRPRAAAGLPPTISKPDHKKQLLSSGISRPVIRIRNG